MELYKRNSDNATVGIYEESDNFVYVVSAGYKGISTATIKDLGDCDDFEILQNNGLGIFRKSTDNFYDEYTYSHDGEFEDLIKKTLFNNNNNNNMTNNTFDLINEFTTKKYFDNEDNIRDIAELRAELDKQTNGLNNFVNDLNKSITKINTIKSALTSAVNNMDVKAISDLKTKAYAVQNYVNEKLSDYIKEEESEDFDVNKFMA